MAHRPVVMLVDDDPLIRDLLCSLFSTHPEFRVGGVAQDGFEGAMLCAEVCPDVVVLDYFMPRWDGERAARFIREHCPSTKILAFSAVLGEPPDWADGFLLKSNVGDLVPLVWSMVQHPTAA